MLMKNAENLQIQMICSQHTFTRKAQQMSQLWKWQ